MTRHLHGRRVLASWPGPGGTYHALEGCGLPTFIYDAKDTTMHAEPEAVALLRQAHDALASLIGAADREGVAPTRDAIWNYLVRRDRATTRMADLPAPTGWTEYAAGLPGLHVSWRHTGMRLDADRAAHVERLVDHFDVRVVVADLASLPDGAEVIVNDCTGSVVEARAHVPVADQAEGLVWMVLRNLLDAVNDPAEFWQSSMGGDPDIGSPGGLRRAAQVLDALRFAQAHARAIEPHADTIAARAS